MDMPLPTGVFWLLSWKRKELYVCILTHVFTYKQTFLYVTIGVYIKQIMS